jgi:hypothetical protein
MNARVLDRATSSPAAAQKVAMVGTPASLETPELRLEARGATQRQETQLLACILRTS